MPYHVHLRLDEFSNIGQIPKFDKLIATIRSNKYDITKHKRYKELADYDKKNAFDVEKYLEHRLVLPKDAEFELYECNVTEEEIKSMESLTENYD